MKWMPSVPASSAVLPHTAEPELYQVIVGAVLMGVINLGMSLMGVDQNMQKVVKVWYFWQQLSSMLYPNVVEN